MMRTATVLAVVLAAFPSSAAADPGAAAVTAFVESVRDLVAARWQSATAADRDAPACADECRVDVVVAVLADGTLLGVSRSGHLGSRFLDDSPVHLLRELGYVAPPPPALRDRSGRALVALRFTRDASVEVAALAAPAPMQLAAAR